MGENHPDVANRLYNVGTMYDAMQRPTEAEDYLLQALRIYQATIGMKHPHTRTCHKDLKGLLLRQGRTWEEAVSDDV